MPRTPVGAQTNARRGTLASRADTVIFSLTKSTEGTFHIEPIVIISDGKYTEPPVDVEASVAKKFTDNYFSVGRQYRVIFGGGDAGSLTVQKFVEDQCGNLLADVVAHTTGRLGGEVHALAVSSDKIGTGASSRRAPTEAERAAALEVARTVYGKRGVGATLVRKMKTVNLTATDIERNGQFELIGGFQIDAGNDVLHNLFIIFEPTADGKYKAAWNWYQKGYEDRKLVDVVDLDGDGTAEVIAEGFEIENNHYVIYKRQAGTWRPVYRGGGGGAC
ncbi:MAG TPA: hypothetical protein VGQ39_16920 [Pyrinomonadaceae bacterium]|jgi:hypothetical protein|nr:hypothetical protein [Pyrinomonadaceae bacterium]